MVQEPHSFSPVWRWIDPPSTHTSKPTSSLDELAGDGYIHLPFPVRYQLEVCLSHGFLNEYTINEDCVSRLAALGEKPARDLLEHIATNKIVCQDAMEIFAIKFITGSTRRLIPKYCCYMRTAQITPSTIYYNTPSVDISNRVVRHYIEYADRFLRVRFTDEKRFGRINSTQNNCMDEVFTRIKRAMANGITIGDRHYEFLAFGNSQFREHGAYFFAGMPNLTASHIRAWMGHFNDIRVVAKHAARLGQCFSTTRAVTGCPVQIREIDDIEHHGHNFSDGVGRISRFLAQMVTTEFNIRTPSGEPPSVFQFRLGGCKGILTVSSEAQRQEVHIRKSQYKFAAVHNGLEIIRHSQCCAATLNRQLIVVLSTLGIRDGVFKKKLRIMLSKIEKSRTDDGEAICLLEKYIDPNQMTLALADMVRDGFHGAKEPFVTSILDLWRAWQIKYLKEKAKIAIEKGVCLFGCVDETKTLKGYFPGKKPGNQSSHRERVDCLPQIFVQIMRPENGGKTEIIEGPCILARNPSLHPGDIRVVNAVNVPALHHLKDVIVLPQTGDRDVASMCSGGDLDGDDYIVMWDQDLVPQDWFREPMNYTPPKPQSLSRDVTVNDITSFFVTYMKTDRLPQIAHAHLALADYLDDGVNNSKCIRLAQLHSAAVDYNKTGIPAQMTRDLNPRKWPHFMEKKFKPKEAQYISKKVLGQLYDLVERVDFQPNLRESFDERILSSDIETSDELMDIVTEVKTLYDADMRRIMTQHEIQTEFEVWSTFVLSHANMSKDYKFHEELGGISSAFKEKFRKLCYEKAGIADERAARMNFEAIAPFVVAMYKVTCNQMKAALKHIDDTNGEPPAPIKDNKPQLPFVSFPWLFQSVLGQIVSRHYDSVGLSERITRLGGQSKFVKKPKKHGELPVGHDVQTAGGVQHPGEVLELFHEDSGANPLNGRGEAFDNNKSAIHTKEGGDRQVGEINAEPSNGSLLDGDERVEADDNSTKPTMADGRENGAPARPCHDDQNGPPSVIPNDQAEPIVNGLESDTAFRAHNDSKSQDVGQKETELSDQDVVSEEDTEENIVEDEGIVKPTVVDELEKLLGL